MQQFHDRLFDTSAHAGLSRSGLSRLRQLTDARPERVRIFRAAFIPWG